MAIIHLRLPADLANVLAREARLANRPRSELARDAIAFYLHRLESDRLLASMEQAARTLSEDPAYCDEVVQLSEEFLPLDNEALALGEQDAGSRSALTRRRRGKA
jgi:predicted transcriptional regulator